MRIVSSVLLAAAVGLSAPRALAQDHAHHHPPTPVHAAAPTQRYATDATLRENMAGIRVALAALEHARHGHLDAGQVTALADRIEGHVRTIVAECTLPPDADAALHGIIAPLAQGAVRLKAAPGDLSPTAPMRAALEAYASGFQD